MQKFFTAIVILFSVQNFSQAQTLTDSLCAYYSFNGNANDNSGNGNNGTVNGATLTTDRFGNANSAFHFNGTSDNIVLTANSHFKPNTFPYAVTAWIKTNGTSAGTIFKNDSYADHYSGVIFQVNPSGVIQIYYGDGGTTGIQYRRSKFGTIPVNDNEWHFVAGVMRAVTDMDLYIDCHYDSAAYYEGGGGAISYSNNNGNCGFVDVVSGNSYFKGDMDEVRLYHRNLTLADLQHLYSYPQAWDGLEISVGNDATPCVGSSYTINSTLTGSTSGYMWSNGATTQNITVTTSGYYSVEVHNDCSYATDTVHIIFVNCEGVNDIETANGITMNYVAENNSVLISSTENFSGEKLSVELFNAVGQRVVVGDNTNNGGGKVAPNHQYEFKLPADLPAGIYLVRARVGEKMKAIKVAKI